MSAFLDDTTTAIDRRLGELKNEVARLEAALRALAEDAQPDSASVAPTSSSARTRTRKARRTATPRSRPATRSSAGARPRARSGGRADQALEHLRQTPGMTTSELAAAMKIKPGYVYTVMATLARTGQVRRQGRSWYAAGEAGSS